MSMPCTHVHAIRLTSISTTGNEANFRTSAYEALASYITHAGPESIPVVQNTALTVLSRMEQLLSMQNELLGIDDRNNWNELQSNLCSVFCVLHYINLHKKEKEKEKKSN